MPENKTTEITIDCVCGYKGIVLGHENNTPANLSIPCPGCGWPRIITCKACGYHGWANYYEPYMAVCPNITCKALDCLHPKEHQIKIDGEDWCGICKMTISLTNYKLDELEKKLLPCPFCNSKGIFTWQYGAMKYTRIWTAKCSSQACFLFHGCFWFRDPMECLTRWNTRAKTRCCSCCIEYDPSQCRCC